MSAEDRSHFKGDVTRYYDNGTDYVLVERLTDNQRVDHFVSISRRAAIRDLAKAALKDDFRILARALEHYANSLGTESDEGKRARFIATWADA